MAGQDALVYRCVPGLAWVKDGGQVLLAGGARGQAWVLDGLEATVWDLLAVRYSFERLVSALAVLYDVPEEKAQTMLLTTVRRWQEIGILSTGEGDQA